MLSFIDQIVSVKLILVAENCINHENQMKIPIHNLNDNYYWILNLRFFCSFLSVKMTMSSHSWLLTVMVALCATAIYGGKLAMPLTDDPSFNKIISTTEENKLNAPIKKWSPDPKIPLADDPR